MFTKRPGSRPGVKSDLRPEVNTPLEEDTSHSSNDDYLITFIVPAVIISIMLFLATVAACVLYRRRRTGKMNVEEDGRQSYGNKGIPVIFQEELDEKPEPGTKTPVILKEEKPPLAPPDYSKSGSVKLSDDSEPYQPPPRSHVPKTMAGNPDQNQLQHIENPLRMCLLNSYILLFFQQ
ncbi:hypothetical protein NQ317_009716 [Molorchus minor]|uniref:Dystroglycan C-terminal domain-containing protein n=1 Tax=Molorchus minor TaxID=1323400 RepID=A0ABQ9JEM8_9CUCU|nr:hypothetical protein NQ317_009716 [Molorchus minor]